MYFIKVNIIRSIFVFIVLFTTSNIHNLYPYPSPPPQLKLSSSQVKKVFNKMPFTYAKIKDQSGLAAVQVTAGKRIFLVAMGDGLADIDYAKGGIALNYTTGTSLTQTIAARVRAIVKVVDIKGSAVIWLHVYRDDSTPMLLIPKKIKISKVGVYTLEVAKKIAIQPNHKYSIRCYIEINQPGISFVKAVTADILKLEWIF